MNSYYYRNWRHYVDSIRRNESLETFAHTNVMNTLLFSLLCSWESFSNTHEHFGLLLQVNAPCLKRHTYTHTCTNAM